MENLRIAHLHIGRRDVSSLSHGNGRVCAMRTPWTVSHHIACEASWSHIPNLEQAGEVKEIAWRMAEVVEWHCRKVQLVVIRCGI